MCDIHQEHAVFRIIPYTCLVHSVVV